jgi:hypothetical protein
LLKLQRCCTVGAGLPGETMTQAIGMPLARQVTARSADQRE